MKLPRRKFLHLTAAAAALPAFSRIARAQAYPSRPITLIVPFAAGGPTDVVARIVAERMSRILGRPLVAENIAGAGGTTGSTRTMRARPDGYTIQIGHMGTHATATVFYPSLPYRPDVDFAPIGLVGMNAFLISATKQFPAGNLNDYTKANHARLNMGHSGVGSTTHLTGLLLNAILAVKPTMVPYNSGSAAMNALVAGHVDYMSAPIPDVVPQFQGATIKVFAIASSERSPALPQVPTTREAGLPEFQVLSWSGLFAPKETPKPILDKLADALNQALDDEATTKRMFELGTDVPTAAQRGPAPLADLVKSEIARWTPIIKTAEIKVE